MLPRQFGTDRNYARHRPHTIGSQDPPYRPAAIVRHGGREFEQELIKRTKVKGTARVILTIILDQFCRGAADCFPGNQRLADEAGVHNKHVPRVIRTLEEKGAFRTFFDGSVRGGGKEKKFAQRRIVLMGHPSTERVLAELARSPFVRPYKGPKDDAPRVNIFDTCRVNIFAAPRVSACANRNALTVPLEAQQIGSAPRNPKRSIFLSP